MEREIKKCVFAGTFDPPTKGHEHVVEESLKIFDEVIIAVLENTSKKCLFTLDERLFLIKKMAAHHPDVRVITFDGAVVDLLEREGTPFYVRGVRNTIDFDYENQNLFANKKLKDDIVTIYIPAEQDELQISSTLIRNSVHFKKDFKDYISEEIIDDIYKMLEEKGNV
jgi:pantetheine-phosphate adenylyltransferase